MQQFKYLLRGEEGIEQLEKEIFLPIAETITSYDLDYLEKISNLKEEGT